MSICRLRTCPSTAFTECGSVTAKFRRPLRMKGLALASAVSTPNSSEQPLVIARGPAASVVCKEGVQTAEGSFQVTPLGRTAVRGATVWAPELHTRSITRSGTQPL